MSNKNYFKKFPRMSKSFFALTATGFLFSFTHLIAMEEDQEKSEIKASHVRDRYGFEYERIKHSDKETKEFYKNLARDWTIKLDRWERLRFSYIVALSYERLGNKEKALHWLKKAAKRGQAEARLYLAEGFLNGNDEFGIQKNYDKSLKWANRVVVTSRTDKQCIQKGKEYLHLAKEAIHDEHDKKHGELFGQQNP